MQSWMVDNCHSFTAKYVTYQHCMTTEGLWVIQYVDKSVVYYTSTDDMKVADYVSLQQVL